MRFESLSRAVIGCAIEVHRQLGPGLLESTYQRCLSHELSLAGVPFIEQVSLPLEYNGVHLECGYRIDLLIDGKLVVELKSVDAIAPIHEAQVLTYMKLMGTSVGLLINFNVRRLTDGIRRFVL
jgi:GxxExxY protein